jgi:toxin YoeB
MAFNLDFTDKALEDIEFHKSAGNKAFLRKLKALLDEMSIHPFSGTGKPEPLKYKLSGLWSRRINKEHRLIYDLSKPYTCNI